MGETSLVKVVKKNDVHEGELGIICKIMELPNAPVTIYTVEFKGNKMKDYFYNDIIKVTNYEC